MKGLDWLCRERKSSEEQEGELWVGWGLWWPLGRVAGTSQVG